jgi:hypothetical protein
MTFYNKLVRLTHWINSGAIVQSKSVWHHVNYNCKKVYKKHTTVIYNLVQKSSAFESLDYALEHQ